MVPFVRRMAGALAAFLLLLTPSPASVVVARGAMIRAPASCGAWSIVPSPMSGTATSYLYGVAGTSESDVWAVGYRADASDNNRQTLIRHWDGAHWRAVAGPKGGGALYAVAALSPRNAWAVGDGPLIEHWNGSRWSVVPSPRLTHDSRNPAILFGVDAVSGSDVWAVGMNWSAPNLTLIEHWNGHQWSVVPRAGTGRLQLFSVVALSARDLRAVGIGGGSLDRAAAMRWNGSRWAQQSITGGPLRALAAGSPRDIWAVGARATAGGSEALIEHWNGAAWVVVSGPVPRAPLSALTGVAAPASTNVWAVGWAGRTVPGDGYADHALLEHWAGTSWRITSAPNTGSPDTQLLGAAAVSTRTVWAVGFTGKHRTTNNHALTERYTHC